LREIEFANCEAGTFGVFYVRCLPTVLAYEVQTPFYFIHIQFPVQNLVH